jgi:outer membrane protein assembly factor BamB
MRRFAAGVVASCLVLAACSGGDEDAKEGSLPLGKAPATAGRATGPALVPRVLLESTDKLEESIGDLDTAQVERRAGAIVTEKLVVGYSVDNVSGYDIKTGQQKWSAKIDLGTGTVCYVSRPETRKVKQITVAYGEKGYCDGVATVRVSDGKVLKTVNLIDVFAPDGRAAGSVNDVITVGSTDHLITFHGEVYRMRKGKPTYVGSLKSDQYFRLMRTPDAPLLVGSRSKGDDEAACSVDAYTLPSFKPAWSKSHAELFPDAKDDCVVSLVQGDSLWAYEETRNHYDMVQLDPKTGDVIGRGEDEKSSEGPTPKGRFDLSYGALLAEDTLGLGDGDVVFPQVDGLARYSLADDTLKWSLDYTGLEMDQADEFDDLWVRPSAVTPDGRYVVATLSNKAAAEVIAVNARTGKLVGRWPVPKKYRNGFQVMPGLTLFDDGVVLTRNFERWDFEFASYQKDVKEPAGDRFDIGVFSFPEPKG